QNGNLHVVNSDGTPFANFPVNLGSNISSAVAVGDLTGDGFKEIVVADEGGYINAVDYQGTTILNYNAGGIFKGNPIIADVDGNGTMEIVATTFSGNLAVVLNSDGSEFQNFPVTIPSGGTLASPAVGDLDGDGNLEIIVASLSGAINAISTASGENLANWPYATGTNTWKGPIVSNIDSDNDPEVLVATGNGKIVAINHDGSLVFERDTGEQIKTSIITGDLDSNGTQEIISISTDGDVYVLDNQGNDFGNYPVDLNVTVESSPILADLEGNGTANIIFGDNSGFLHALDLTGNDIDNFPIYLGSSNKVGPAIGDTDGDGDPEILLPNQNAYILIDFKQNVPDSRIQWAAFKRNARRTGNSFDPATGIDDNDLIPVFTDFLAQNYPNPFNPDTNISFSLQEEGIIRLDVFNMKGQLVRSLVNEELPAGYHIVNWNGKDNENKDVGSGIYLYKLNSKKFNSVKKMLLIK
ncbi:MAG: VCBS repeat-containing protein, partial [Candidatus Cloacimonetes bacterium]|nr:VCBS repeat-containing protein [Candidatus Cloacimonadota bacterium]